MPRVLVALTAGAAAASVAIVRGGPGAGPRPGRGGGWDFNLAQSPFQRSEVGAAADRRSHLRGWLPRREPDHRQHGRVRHLGGRVARCASRCRGGEPPRASRRSGGTSTSWAGSAAPRTAAASPLPPAGGEPLKRLPDAPTARAAMGFAARGAKLFAAGGQNDRSFELRRLEVYDVRKRRWRRLTRCPPGATTHRGGPRTEPSGRSAGAGRAAEPAHGRALRPGRGPLAASAKLTLPAAASRRRSQTLDHRLRRRGPGLRRDHDRRGRPRCLRAHPTWSLNPADAGRRRPRGARQADSSTSSRAAAAGPPGVEHRRAPGPR